MNRRGWFDMWGVFDDDESAPRAVFRTEYEAEAWRSILNGAGIWGRLEIRQCGVVATVGPEE